MTGSILTFWEITEGELTEGTGEFISCFTAVAVRVTARILRTLIPDFYGLPPALLRKSIETLVKRGKAQVIRGEGESGEGVRFF